MIQQIELENVGPIESLSIPIPEGGGLVVLRGRNGNGKTHAINAVEALYDKQARKTLRNSDGTPAGTVKGLGVSVRLGRSNTAKGELVCESLDGRIDPSKLVDPGIKDPVAADARRLATLIRLAGLDIGLEQWKQELPAEVADAIDLPSLVDEDPVATADRIRRKVHDLAKQTERKAERAAGESQTLRQSIADIDLEAESDNEVLTAALDAATSALAAAKQRNLDAVAAHNRAAEAKRYLAENEALAVNAEQAEQEAFRVRNLLTEKQNELTALREKLHALQAEIRDLEKDKQAADDKAELAQKQAQQLAKWRDMIAADLPEILPPGEIEELAEAKQAAQAAVQNGAVVRMAKESLRQAEIAGTTSLELGKRAKTLRELARGSDSILERALLAAGFDQIKVVSGRLCIESDRGKEPFDELSHGERWRLALDLAAQGLPKGAVLPVCQEAFESLDPVNRSHIQRLARERGLVIITAEASDGELRAEIEEAAV